jgi:hypothetical protein
VPFALLIYTKTHIWFKGEIIPPLYKKLGYDCKIDMRVTIPDKKPVDLNVVEYVKKSSPSKYYKDKVKTVLCSAIYHWIYQKENSNIKQVPAMLIARLENEVLLYYQIDNNWCVVDKVKDADVPNSIQDIKNSAIEGYVKSIKCFKVPNCYIHKLSLSHYEFIPA